MPSEQLSPWKVRELMTSAIDQLQKKGFDEARLNVELLLSHSLSCKRIHLYTGFDKPLTKREVDEFRMLLDRRLKHEPVQYIIGSTNFMGLELKVDSRVLIPRPETETLVEQVVFGCHELDDASKINIIEIGTGSGNIAIALAKYIKKSSITTIDNSGAALEVAKINITAHGVASRVTLREIDVFEPVDQLLLRRFDVLVSNPPYVPPDEWEGLRPEVRDYEPRNATADSKDGFEFYRRLVELAPYLLVDEGAVYVEVGFGQAPEVRRLMEAGHFSGVSVTQDLQGTNRVVKGRCRAKSRNPVVSN